MDSTIMHIESDDPVLFGPQQLVSSTKFSKNVGAFLDKTRSKPVFITRDNEVAAVLIGIDDYRNLLREALNVEELGLAVKTLQRVAEHITSGDPLVDMDTVLEKFDLFRQSVHEVEDDEDLDG
ncbi:MAG: type II toxin-antitoxin system Phd/YefM family antitoxin [Thermacetogeniaceae bacterium]|jgi:PHD/YefM family antitoxin component YafN of YafNO toxin-antitoxin module